MQKLTLILICCLCFWAMPAFAQQNDVAEATKALEAYYEASIQGDLEGSFTFMTKAYRAQNEALISETAGLLELGVILSKQSEFKINSVQPEGAEIHAVVDMTMPNLNQIFIKASDGLSPELTEQEFTEQLIAKSIKLLKQESFSRNTETVNVIMVKEDGLWKIANEL